MRWRTTAARALMASAVAGGLALVGSGTAAAAEPICSGTLGIAVHGQHVGGDYVTRLGGGTLGWRPDPGVVGGAVAGSGAVTPGGPGPGFHFPSGFAPGASFCLSQSQAPGTHPGP